MVSNEWQVLSGGVCISTASDEHLCIILSSPVVTILLVNIMVLFSKCLCLIITKLIFAKSLIYFLPEKSTTFWTSSHILLILSVFFVVRMSIIPLHFKYQEISLFD